MRTALIALAAVAASGFAYAQTPDAQSAGDAPDIVVTAPDRDELRAFVGSVATTGRGQQLARWDDDVCPGVVGMREDVAQALIERIARAARELDLDVGRPGCTANIVIVGTHDSDALARNFADDTANHIMRSDNSLGRRELEAFANTPRAVRWWYNTGTHTSDGVFVPRGVRLAPSAQDTSGLTGPAPGWSPTMVHVRTSGHINRNVREDMSRAIVIVDAGRISGVRLDALGDYIAMVTLAQVDPDADVSNVPSILNLFAGGTINPSAPTDLTNWDKAYLEGLYSANRYALSSGQQRGRIVRSMAEVSDDAPAP